MFPLHGVARVAGDRDGLRPAEAQASHEQDGGQDAANGPGKTAVDPARHRDEHEAEHQEEQGVVVVLGLAGEHPEQPPDSGVEGEGHELLEGLHPRTGARQQFHGGGEEREQQVGCGQPGGDEREDQHRFGCGEGGRKCRPEGRGQERRTARRRDQHRQDPGEKRPGVTLLHLQLSTHGGGREADFKQPAEVEGENQQERRHAEDKAGRLELGAPANLLAAGPQGENDPGEYPEREQHAQGVDEAVRDNLAAVVARLMNEAQHLDAEHREHAGHEV